MKHPKPESGSAGPIRADGRSAPSAPYITQRQQDEQGCPFCGGTRIQVVELVRKKRRLFRKGTREKTILRRVCADCGQYFK